MLDIGPIHRKEYEIAMGRFKGKASAKDSPKSASKKGKNADSKGKSRSVKAPAGKSKGKSTSKNAPEPKSVKKSTAAQPEKGNEPVIIAQAPGRIHLLGDHGDPFAGIYLSVAIDRWVKVAVSPRKDHSLRFFAADLGERKRNTLVNLKYRREDRWANYIKMAIQLFVDLGYPVKGMNFTITGDIPQQIGLASSSAIEVAAAVALRVLFRAKINDQELVKRLAASHEAFFGEKSNPADYIIGLLARSGQLLLIDEANLSVVKIKSPFTRCKLLLFDSHVPRLNVEVELEDRKETLKTGLEMLSQGKEGANFREIATMDLMDSMGNLPEEIRRRSLHVVQEIRRVFDAGDCLMRFDLSGFTRLIFHSHESLRDLYEVSCPEIDWLVKRAQETVGVWGARMTGSGFGGCTYTIIKNEAVKEYLEKHDEYERIFGFSPGIYEVKIATGSKIVDN